MKNPFTMKSKVLILVAIVAVFSLFAFTVAQTKSLANVDQQEGVFLFIHSKPAGDYKFLGKVNMPEIVWNGKSKEMINIAIRRAKKQFPDADGIIFQSEDLAKVDAVKLPE